jgi:DNA-binding transcriptional regulator YiaG/uncharacterized phage-associated protein
MKSPYTGKEMELKRVKSVLNFRKEPFEVVYHSFVCRDTQEEFEDDRLTSLNMKQVTDQYREKHNIPFPEQIKATRKSFGLSAAKMSEILGLGTNSWRLYENGEVPTIANARLTQLISDPQNFMKHISEFGTCEEKEIEKIKKNIDEISRKAGQTHYLENLFQTTNPNRISGYSRFSKTKTEQAVLFFAVQLAPYKTAMNKLLFYADFLHFKQAGRSITGLRYVAIDFGPVPDHFSSLYEMITDEGLVKIEGIMTDYGFTERVVPGNNVKFEASAFSDSELEVLQIVHSRFKTQSSKEIVESSHQEEAWLANISTKSLISYTYAYSILAV